MSDKDTACEHGVPGGCEVTCESCGHTCKRHHHNHGHCDADIGNGACGCHDYEGTSG